METKDKLEIMIASDTAYEHVVAEIYADKRFVALVHQDRGLNDLRVVFPGPEVDSRAVNRDVNLGVLLDALDAARRRLLGQ